MLHDPSGPAFVPMARVIVADLAAQGPRESRRTRMDEDSIWKRGLRANAYAEESAKVVDFYS